MAAFASADESRLALLFGAASVGAYALSLVVSRAATPRLFPDLVRLSRKDAQEWHYRVPSTVHAVVITALAAYTFLWAHDFDQPEAVTPLVLRHTPLSTASLAFSFGYFAVDLIATLAEYPSLGGADMVGHHVAALSSVGTALVLEQGHAATLFMLATECTTPFVNARWWLSAAGSREGRAYLINGIALVVMWTLGRVVSFPLFFSDLWQRRHELRAAAWPCRVQIVLVPVVLFTLNLIWYSKILRGAAKALLGRSDREIPEDAGREGLGPALPTRGERRPAAAVPLAKTHEDASLGESLLDPLAGPQVSHRKDAFVPTSSSSSDEDDLLPTHARRRSPSVATASVAGSHRGSFSSTADGAKTASAAAAATDAVAVAARSADAASRDPLPASEIIVERLGTSPASCSPYDSPRHSKSVRGRRGIAALTQGSWAF